MFLSEGYAPASRIIPAGSVGSFKTVAQTIWCQTLLRAACSCLEKVRNSLGLDSAAVAENGRTAEV